MDAWGVGVLPSGYLLNIVNYGIDGWKVMKMVHWWMSKVMIYLEMVIFPFLCKKQPEGTSDRTTIWIRQQGISSGELDACRSDPWLCTWQQDGPRIRTTTWIQVIPWVNLDVFPTTSRKNVARMSQEMGVLTSYWPEKHQQTDLLTGIASSVPSDSRPWHAKAPLPRHTCRPCKQHRPERLS